MKRKAERARKEYVLLAALVTQLFRLFRWFENVSHGSLKFDLVRNPASSTPVL